MALHLRRGFDLRKMFAQSGCQAERASEFQQSR